MKITFLVVTADAMGGTERAVFTQAEHLVRDHEVEVLSVLRTSETPFFALDPRLRIRYLVDAVGPVPRPMRDSTLTDEQCRALAVADGRVLTRRWEKSLSRLTEIELERALPELDADVVVSSSPALMAAVTTLCDPRVVTVHQEHRPSQLRGATGEPIFSFVPRLDALVLLTERTRLWFENTLGDAAPHLTTIRNALPPGFRPRSSRTNRVVTIAGRLVNEKQVDQAIHAFRQVAEAHPDWVLRVLGDGPKLRSLRKLAESLGLNENVQFLGSVRHMAEEWAKSSIAVLTSRDGEALPLVLIEAFAAGVPAVSYDIETGPAEIITHGVDGFVVGSGDVDGLAAAIGRLIEDEPMRQSFGAAALRAAAAYDLDTVMAEWVALYERLVAERGEERAVAKSDRMAAWVAGTGGSGVAPAAPRPVRPPARPDARDRELAIARRDRSLLRSGGQLAIASDEMSPYDVADRNLRLVADALDRHAVGHWLVRDHGIRPRLAVLEADRPAALRAFAAEWADDAIYADLLSPAGIAGETTLASLVASSGEAVAGVRIFQPVATSSRTLRYGAAYGCDVEFWSRDDTGDGLLPLTRTLLGDVIPAAVAATPATIEVRDRKYPTFTAFTETLVADVDFAIDAVYTWVDGDDPAWQTRKAAAMAELGRPAPEAAAGENRFASRDELRYSLRSIAMNAPWIRTIWLVTDDQTPEWLDTAHPGVRVVSHRDIFGERGALPTFNSHAIESRLHHIEGLAEHFLYFNDDFFLGRPVHPTRFFTSNGVAQHFRSPTAVALTPIAEDDDFNFTAAKNNRALIKEAFGHTLTHGFLHAPYALRVSVLREIEERFATEIDRTARSRVRAATDVSVPSSLHHYYGYFTGRSAPGSIRVAYVDIGDPAQHPRLTQILTMRNHDAFCLNDTHHSPLPAAERGHAMEVFLRSYFPVASEYERGSARNRRPRS